MVFAIVRDRENKHYSVNVSDMYVHAFQRVIHVIIRPPRRPSPCHCGAAPPLSGGLDDDDDDDVDVKSSFVIDVIIIHCPFL